jgi:hypothetical protein
VSVGRTNVVAITVILVLFVAYMVFLFGFVGR